MENIQENRKIEIGQESLGYLNITRKWTMFFAILGFVLLGIMLIIGFLAGSFMSTFTSKMPGMEDVEGAKAAGGIASGFIIIFQLVFAVIYFFPLLFLFRFSRHTKNAVSNFDANELQLGLKNLKSYWMYIGILAIVALAVLFLVLIIAGGSLALFSGLKG